MRDHYIVCGYGRTGAAVAEEFRAHGCEIVVIDEDESRLEVAREAGLAALAGDATEESVMVEAHADTARGLAASTESDAENTFISLTARAQPGRLHRRRGSQRDGRAAHAHRGSESRLSAAPHRRAQAGAGRDAADGR